MLKKLPNLDTLQLSEPIEKKPSRTLNSKLPNLDLLNSLPDISTIPNQVEEPILLNNDEESSEEYFEDNLEGDLENDLNSTSEPLNNEEDDYDEDEEEYQYTDDYEEDDFEQPSEITFQRKLQNIHNLRLVEAVERMLLNGRRYFGSSGASLTHHISNPAFNDKKLNPASVKVGLTGENKTSLKLKEWIKDKPNAILVDSIHLDTAEDGEVDEEDMTLDSGDTDHAIIIGNHIIIIDSKAWKSKRSYSVDDNGTILRTKKTFAGGNVRAKGAKYLWKEYFKAYSTEISSIIVITSEEVFVVRDMNWWKQPFMLTNYNDLYKWLDKIYDETKPSNKWVIYTDLVAHVVSMCVKPYDIVKELFSK